MHSSFLLDNDLLSSLKLFQEEVIVWNKKVFENIFKHMKIILAWIEGIQKFSNYPYRFFLQNLEQELLDIYDSLFFAEKEFWMTKY